MTMVQIIRKRGRPSLPNMVRDKTTGRSRGEAVESIIATALLPRLKSGISYEESIVRDLRTGKILGSNQDAGHILGRLRMLGAKDPGGISENQFNAGWEYAQVVMRYRTMIGLPSESPKAMDLSGNAGRTLASDPDEKIISQARRKYNLCFEVLNMAGHETHQGNRVTKITNDVCMDRIGYQVLKQDLAALGNLRAGLNALARVLR